LLLPLIVKWKITLFENMFVSENYWSNESKVKYKWAPYYYEGFGGKLRCDK
jgi:hypothetical protein